MEQIALENTVEINNKFNPIIDLTDLYNKCFVNNFTQ